jgi:hypothetical protein
MSERKTATDESLLFDDVKKRHQISTTQLAEAVEPTEIMMSLP